MIRSARMALLAILLGIGLHSAAQPAQGGGHSASGVAEAAPAGDLAPTLARLERASQATVAALGDMRIDRWKTSADGKRDAERNAQSVVRNLNSALPALIAAARNAPDSTSAAFKLYRNLNALYDVMSGLGESAGAFGSDRDFRALGEQLRVLDDSRTALANRLEARTAQQEADIARLRDSLRAATTPPATQASATPPKKAVVDNGPAPSAARKKKSTPASKPASATPPGAN